MLSCSLSDSGEAAYESVTTSMYAALGRRRPLERLIEFAARRDPRGKPSFAAEGMWKLRIMPGRDVVVTDTGIFAEQPFDQVSRIIKHKDDGLQTEAAELTDLLGCELMRTIACDQNHSLAGSRNRRSE